MIKAFIFDAYGTLYDVQSVSDIIETSFPGYGEYITQVWRMKQLEYSWLRSMMGKYENFWTVTQEALDYTLRTLELRAEASLFEEISDSYNKLSPYPDAENALNNLSDYRLAILSNGSPDMLSALVTHSSLGQFLEEVISIDSKKAYKPDRRAYELVEEQLGIKPDEIAFVTSNGFDACGARNFGFKVIRIERIKPSVLCDEIRSSKIISPNTMFKATRMQDETCGDAPDFRIGSLSELPALAAKLVEHDPALS